MYSSSSFGLVVVASIWKGREIGVGEMKEGRKESGVRLHLSCRSSKKALFLSKASKQIYIMRADYFKLFTLALYIKPLVKAQMCVCLLQPNE